jgi:hypothetical protein
MTPPPPSEPSTSDPAPLVRAARLRPGVIHVAAGARLARALGQVVLGLWLVAMLGLGAALLAKHLVALPTPPRDDPAVAAAVSARAPRGAWFAVHILYRPCPCSGRILAHLLATTRPADLREQVVLVDDVARDDDTVARLRARGFVVELLTPAELAARWHDEASPLLVIADPGGAVRYVGGYGRHKQSPIVEDLAILADLRAAHDRAALPVFGCATSARLSRRVDPLGLARWR